MKLSPFYDENYTGPPTFKRPNVKSKYWQKRFANKIGYWAFLFSIAKENGVCFECKHLHYPCPGCYDHGCGGSCVELCGCRKFADPPLTDEEKAELEEMYGVLDV